MSEISTKARTRHSIVALFYGLLRGRNDDDQSAMGGGEETSGAGQEGSRQEVAGPQTNIGGKFNGPVLSGQFEGPVQVGDRITQNIQQHEMPPVPGQIPAPPKDFTGRSKEIDELLTGFEKGATITGLQGTGGIGKTALALVVAERLKARFPDGQIFINLLGTGKNPMDVASAMAHVIVADREPGCGAGAPAAGEMVGKSLNSVLI